MAVPSPSIKPLAVAGGTHTFVYTGAVGVTGSVQDLNIDLTDIEKYIRLDPKFIPMLLVTFKGLDDGITLVGPSELQSSDFHGSVSGDYYVTVQVTSDSVDNECMVLLEPRHTLTR